MSGSEFNCAICDKKAPHGHTLEEMADAMARQGVEDEFGEEEYLAPSSKDVEEKRG